MRASVLSEGEWRSADVDFVAGRIAQRAGPAKAPYIVPGLVDIHCHGVNGLDVMEGAAAEIATELRRFGVEWVCPTTVTASWKSIEDALAPGMAPGIAGYHLEGPFLNPARCGAQPEKEIKKPDMKRLSPLLENVRIMTLAPEIPGALEVVGKLVSRGIIVSAGHTDASYDDLQAARERGLAHMTHFYNAMRSFTARDPGCIGFGLLTDIVCELIYDRQHVSLQAARLMYASKSPDTIVGISDGTMLSGMPEGTRANMWGHQVECAGGCVRLRTGVLAGSCVTLADVLTNLWQDIGSAEAVTSCSLAPRKLLGLPEAELWLVVGEDGSVEDVVTGRLAL